MFSPAHWVPGITPLPGGPNVGFEISRNQGGCETSGCEPQWKAQELSVGWASLKCLFALRVGMSNRWQDTWVRAGDRDRSREGAPRTEKGRDPWSCEGRGDAVATLRWAETHRQRQPVRLARKQRSRNISQWHPPAPTPRQNVNTTRVWARGAVRVSRAAALARAPSWAKPTRRIPTTGRRGKNPNRNQGQGHASRAGTPFRKVLGEDMAQIKSRIPRKATCTWQNGHTRVCVHRRTAGLSWRENSSG